MTPKKNSTATKLQAFSVTFLAKNFLEACFKLLHEKQLALGEEGESMKWEEQKEAASKAVVMPRVDEAFFQRVYEQVAQVPEGWVCTYGTIAHRAGYAGAAREVGYAMSQVRPEQNLAAHRSVNAKGTLSPDSVFGGPGKQRALLEGEGVSFLANGTINMAVHAWPPQDTEKSDQLSLF